MIWCELRADVPFNRVITPRWAHKPTSGDGAATKGGRLNRPKTTALYLSRGAETAIKEYQQDDPLLAPGVVATFLVNLDRIVDFSRGYDPDVWDSVWVDFNCNWRKLAYFDEIEPPSWLLADIVLANKAEGILFPSMRVPGGINLIIYSPELLPAGKLRVHDPHGELDALKPK